MKALRNSLDLIIDTVGTPHDIDAEMQLLRLDGTLVLLGGSPQPHPAPGAFTFIMKRRRLAGSLIGGIAETQEMLDFCAEHNIVSNIELVDASDASAVDAAYDRVVESDVRYRFVIDASTI
jgi:uncharacterized zinc-type alcohol dehydrogenase-like protein